MSIESGERQQLDGRRGASMIGRKPFENGSTGPRARRGASARRSVAGSSHHGALACVSKRHIVGVQEPAYGKCRLKGMTPAMCLFGDDGTAAMPAPMPTPDLVLFGGKEYHVVIIHRPQCLSAACSIASRQIGSSQRSVV